MLQKVPELLAPVGGEDSVTAALRGGADAVYFGGSAFNARMHAKNFSPEATRRTVYRCHERGVRVFITLNTLIFDRKLEEALRFAESLYLAGCDALILADLGLTRLIRRNFPDFELHASTQLSVHNSLAGEKLRELGFSRMVCARELSAENIRLLCRNSPIPIEMFVHGAICACHSGQCLMSSFIGERSGNRGECAQPCRLPYNGGYPLSFKDMCLAGNVREILSLGVESLKIEGRMKSPSYVYAVTRAYRTLLDEKRNATPQEIESLARVFSRSGFTNGYFTGKITASMLGTRREEDKKNTAAESVRFADCAPLRAPICMEREPKPAEPVPKPAHFPAKPLRTARFFSPAAIPETDFFDLIFLPLEKFDGAKAQGFVMPPVIPDTEIGKVKTQIEKALQNGAQHALVGNAGHLTLLAGKGLCLHGDFRLNLCNSQAALAFPELEDMILSPELNLAQMRDLACKKSIIVYGRVPLMLLEKKLPFKKLSDRRGVVFPVLQEGGRDLVLNSVPIYMADRQKELKKNHLRSKHFLFTTESKAEVLQIISLYREEKEAPFPIRRIK